MWRNFPADERRKLVEGAVCYTISPVHTGEDRLQRVIIDLGDGIEFVVMTARALSSGACEGLHHGVVPLDSCFFSRLTQALRP